MSTDVKTNYMFSSTGTRKINSEEARGAIEAVREAVRISKKHDPPNIRAPITLETQVAEAVRQYFLESQFDGFSVYSDHEIEIGNGRYRADVVLCDADGKFSAIAECKLQSGLNYAHEPLKSFLYATDVSFGIFATDVDKNSWYFYENLDHNRFRLIDQSDFEKGIGEHLKMPAHSELAV